MKHILDAEFRYKPSFDTDISKRFERLKREAKLRLEKCAACEPWFDGSVFAEVRESEFRDYKIARIGKVKGA